MTGASFVLRDTATMLRRNLLHARRYPSLTLLVAAMPVIFYLIFVYVFGSTLGDGLPGVVGGRDAYIAYLTPGILIVTVASGVSSTAIVIAMDKHEGIVLRFRTMSIPRAAVLAGHVVNGMLQTMLSILLVIAVAVLTGFRPTTGLIEIAGAIGMIAVASFAFTWLAVPIGLVSNSVETASNLPLPLLLLPFFGSGFVPPESMPWPISWFAAYQPFTPMIETVRGLLLGTPIGWNGAIALGWCAFIGLVGYLCAMRLYDRDPVPGLARLEDDNRRLTRAAHRERVEVAVARVLPDLVPQPIALLAGGSSGPHGARSGLQLDTRVRIRLEVQPPGGLRARPAVHRQRHQVRPVLDVGDDRRSSLPRATTDRLQPQVADLIARLRQRQPATAAAEPMDGAMPDPRSADEPAWREPRAGLDRRLVDGRGGHAESPTRSIGQPFGMLVRSIRRKGIHTA